MKNKIIYPFILECCNYTDDYFWKNIFEDLSYGKSPFGTYIYKNTIIHTVKNKDFTYVITNKKTAKENYDNLYKLFTQKLGLKSLKETYIKKKSDEDDIVLYNSWNQIKKKKIKDVVINLFIIEKKEEFNLKIEDCRKFIIILYISLLFKTITSKHIEMEDGRIISIEGIKFFKGKRNLSPSRENANSEKKNKASNGGCILNGKIIYDLSVIENYNKMKTSRSMISKKDIYNNWKNFMEKINT